MIVPIRTESDIVEARLQGRAVAEAVGIAGTDLTLIATAISEIARNILAYAHRGEILIEEALDGGRRGVRIVARDAGPGIEDVERALEDGYTTGGGLGLGLPGARRLMDDFDLVSSPEAGTTVTMVKWAQR